MKIKSAGRVGFLFIVASLFMVSAVDVVAITALQLPATESSQARADDGKKPRFVSNSIMVKLTRRPAAVHPHGARVVRLAYLALKVSESRVDDLQNTPSEAQHGAE